MVLGLQFGRPLRLPGTVPDCKIQLEHASTGGATGCSRQWTTPWLRCSFLLFHISASPIPRLPLREVRCVAETPRVLRPLINFGFRSIFDLASSLEYLTLVFGFGILLRYSFRVLRLGNCRSHTCPCDLVVVGALGRPSCPRPSRNLCHLSAAKRRKILENLRCVSKW